MASALFSALHILAFGLGLPAIYFRGQALRRADLPAILRADTVWGIAAMLWLATGLVRVFYTEKGASWYSHQPLFWLKMGIFGVVWLLELWPMITFIRWRVQLGRNTTPNLQSLTLLQQLNRLELGLTLLLPFVAAMMARGITI